MHPAIVKRPTMNRGMAKTEVTSHRKAAPDPYLLRLSMSRIFNFSAGPAVLPEPVLARAAEEMLDWHGSGMSVMEMSHRGDEFIGIHAQAEANLRELLSIPKNYKVLFLQGGAAANV